MKGGYKRKNKNDKSTINNGGGGKITTMYDNRKQQYIQPGTGIEAVIWSIVGNIINSKGTKTNNLHPTSTQQFKKVIQKKSTTS